MRNRGKNRLGLSPLRTPLGYGVGGASRLWSALVSCQSRKAVAPCIVHSQASRALPPLQGLSWECCSRSRLPEAWVSAAGNSRCTKERPGQGHYLATRASCHGGPMWWHSQEQQETSRAGGDLTHCHPAPAGWIPQGGGRPLLWRFFPPFLIVGEMGPSGASPLPGWQASYRFLQRHNRT